MYNETIAAAATPYGRGGVAMIRVSGDEALSICEKIFSPAGGKKLSEYPPRRAVYGDIYSSPFLRADAAEEEKNERQPSVIDDGIATYFKAPHSYTGEDTVEICCHGGIRLVQSILEGLFEAGAKQAQAGEYTKRAFLNGKLSLSRAEAVINLIDAQTDEQIKLAASHRKGVLSKCADRIYQNILGLVSSAYAYIDYPDEDLTDVTVPQLKKRLKEITDELERLEGSYKIGRAVSEGIKTAIVGKPNAGKSSLLNAMLGEERAIVTDIAGTTRDIIEEKVKLEHIVLCICDTAGIRETDDKIEKIGVNLALEKILDAGLVYAVFDGSKPLDKEDISVISYIRENCGDKIVIALLNKADEGENEETLSVIKSTFTHTLKISAKEKLGLEKLYEMTEQFFIDGEIDYDTTAVLSNARQHAAVKRALSSVKSAYSALCRGYTQDVAGMDLEQALSAIGEIDTKSVGEDVVKEIFGRFCVGK